MHIFLTGETRVGKSTIIERLLMHVNGKKLGGFRTVCGENLGVFILPPDYSADYPQTEKNRIGIRNGVGCGQAFPKVFDSLGIELLSDAESCDLVLMDELGRLEKSAKQFTSRVLEILDGKVQVLGVVKPKPSPFLNAVRDHPNTRIIEVTPENRERVFHELKVIVKECE